MFIIVSIYSKNLNSLTNFLKFFYKLQRNQRLKVKFHAIQSQKKKKFYFFSTLQSPHVNKKSQEQFEYYVHGKKLKIHVSQITKFLAIWKLVNTTLFYDVKIKTEFWLQNKSFNSMLLPKINYDKFKSLTVFKSGEKLSENLNLDSVPKSSTFLTLLDIRGEILLKNFFTGLDSSVGRAKDWKSLCRQFNPVSKHIIKPLLWKIYYEIYPLVWKTVKFPDGILFINPKLP